MTPIDSDSESTRYARGWEKLREIDGRAGARVIEAWATSRRTLPGI